MKNAKIIPMLPGPVSVPEDILRGLAHDHDAGHQERDHLPLYEQTGKLLGRIMGTPHDVVIMTGEGMLALWAALKSCLKAGDKVLSVGTGVFGDGIGQMAASFGCRVEAVSLPYNSTIGQDDSLERIREAAKKFQPKMITAVHCETPSGTLNPLAELGRIKKDLGVPLFYVDAVASIGGAEVLGESWNIDLLLGGTQKCLSAPPSMSFLSVSPAAWESAREVGYQGYDALLPFKAMFADNLFPYTPYPHGLTALKLAAERLLAEGLPACFARHQAVAEQCRLGLARLGLELFPRPGAINSPTVSAIKIPDGRTWPDWRDGLQARGLTVGGSFGPMAGKVFRLGHMGSQADKEMMKKALEILADALKA